MNIYLTAKKIHRLALWTTSVLGIAQGLTGMSLKFNWGGAWIQPLHSQTGVFFVMTFLVSMVTGLTMYVALLPKRVPTDSE